MKAVVTGMIGTYPVGGVVWDYGQYALGLERLGFEVFYLEDTGAASYDPRRGAYTEDGRYGIDYLGNALEGLSPGLGKRWRYRSADGTDHGASDARLAEAIAGADVFLNVSGGTLLRDEYMAARRKVLIETDPGWNHFRNFPRWDANPRWQESHGFRAHDHFFTFAERIGSPDCPLPDFGLSWVGTRQPVVMDLWKAEPPGTTWTTVMTWKNFKESIEFGGRTYGTKEREFSKVEDMPRLTRARLEVAVGGARPPRSRWRRIGWSVVESEEVSRSPADYRSYVQSSRGEFSVAKNVYVETRSGWFSGRSACYLASGRPVVVQDTGFSETVPTGEGLLAFSTLDEAVLGIESVERNYARHQDAAREVARTHFASEVVLTELLSRIGL